MNVKKNIKQVEVAQDIKENIKHQIKFDNKKDKIGITRVQLESYNKYLIPFMLGIIVFMNTDLIQTFAGNIDEETALGINGLSSILLVSTLLLLYATAPKHHIILKLRNQFLPKKVVSLKTWSIKSDKLDIYISLIIWCSLFILLFIASLLALFKVF